MNSKTVHKGRCLPKAHVTVSMLRKYFRYDCGIFYWKRQPGKNPNIKEGSSAGCKARDGYTVLKLKGLQFFAHRAAWAMHYGEWPMMELDHINGIRSDNRIKNLRQVTPAENQKNRNFHREGGFVGTNFLKHSGRWRARAPRKYLSRDSDRGQYLGCFQTKEEAHAAVVAFCSSKYSQRRKR